MFFYNYKEFFHFRRQFSNAQKQFVIIFFLVLFHYKLFDAAKSKEEESALNLKNRIIFSYENDDTLSNDIMKDTVMYNMKYFSDARTLNDYFFKTIADPRNDDVDRGDKQNTKENNTSGIIDLTENKNDEGEDNTKETEESYPILPPPRISITDEKGVEEFDTDQEEGEEAYVYKDELYEPIDEEAKNAFIGPFVLEVTTPAENKNTEKIEIPVIRSKEITHLKEKTKPTEENNKKILEEGNKSSDVNRNSQEGSELKKKNEKENVLMEAEEEEEVKNATQFRYFATTELKSSDSTISNPNTAHSFDGQEGSTIFHGYTHAIVLIHGFGPLPIARVYYQETVEAAIKWGVNLNTTTFIVPQFLMAQNKLSPKWKVYDSVEKENIITWEGGDWITGDAPENTNVLSSSYSIIDEMLMRLANKEVYPDMKRISIFGHSGGGQLTQRYALANNMEGYMKIKGIQMNYIVANAATFAYLTPHRYNILTDSFQLPEEWLTLENLAHRSETEQEENTSTSSTNNVVVKSKLHEISDPDKDDEEDEEPIEVMLPRPPGRCSTFNAWKYGLENPMNYMTQIETYKSDLMKKIFDQDGDLENMDPEEENIVQRYLKRNVIYIVGDEDKNTNNHDFSFSCMALLQGSSRFNRGIVYVKYLHDIFPEWLGKSEICDVRLQKHLATCMNGKHQIIVLPGVGHDVAEVLENFSFAFGIDSSTESDENQRKNSRDAVSPGAYYIDTKEILKDAEGENASDREYVIKEGENIHRTLHSKNEGHSPKSKLVDHPDSRKLSADSNFYNDPNKNHQYLRGTLEM